MNEAPKKIWLHKGFWDSGDSCYWTDEDTDPKYKIGNHYIRADLVDRLVEALELLVSYGNVFSYKAGQESPYEIARAALKALEEE